MGSIVLPLHQTPQHSLSEMASKLLLAALLSVGHSSPIAPAPYAPYPAEPAYPDIAPNYNYQFGVNDAEYSGAVFSHQEDREAYNTKGEYRVNLPDGRVQIVSYTAGPEGYVADVRYEGEAVYPEAAPYAPAPAYKPAPAPVVKVAPAPVVYKPAPKVYKPAPVVYKPAPKVYKPAPVYHAAPAYHAPAYHHSPVYHKPTSYAPKKYGYSVITTEAPAPEPEVKEAEPEAEAVEEEAAVTEAAAVKTEEAPAPAYDAPAAAEAERYRYRQYRF